MLKEDLIEQKGGLLKE